MSTNSNENDDFALIFMHGGPEKFGADIGRIIGYTDQGMSVGTLKAAAQKILDALGIELEISRHPLFLCGLIYGVKERCGADIPKHVKSEMRKIVKAVKDDLPV